MNLANRYNLFLTLNYGIRKLSFIEVWEFLVFQLIITSITPAFALYTPPTKEENDIFESITCSV